MNESVRVLMHNDGRLKAKLQQSHILTHLVEVFQQVDYPALDLVLGQTGRRGVESDRLRDETGSELRHTSSDGGAADLEGSRGLDSDTGGGGPQGAHNGGAEHGE